MEDGFDKKLHELWVAENGRATKIAAYAKRHDAFEDLRRRVDGGDLRTFAIRNPVGAWQYFRAELTRPATLRRERPATQAAPRLLPRSLASKTTTPRPGSRPCCGARDD